MWRRIVGGSLIGISRWLGKLAGMHKLESIDTIPLLCSIAEVETTYGPPMSSESNTSFPEAKEYVFRASPFHDCVVWEWQGQVHAIIYHPEFGFPDPDLNFMFETYGQSLEWRTINQGYLYFRQDDRVRLWCSALPPIGVATQKFWRAKEEANRERRAAD